MISCTVITQQYSTIMLCYTIFSPAQFLCSSNGAEVLFYYLPFHYQEDLLLVACVLNDFLFLVLTSSQPIILGKNGAP